MDSAEASLPEDDRPAPSGDASVTARSNSAEGSSRASYYIRLARASALVLLSIAVHLWIDGRDGRSPVSQASGLATGIARVPPAVRGALASMSAPAAAVAARHASTSPAIAGVGDGSVDESPVASTAGRIHDPNVPGATGRPVDSSDPRAADGVRRTSWLPDPAPADNAVIPARHLAVWTRGDDVLPPVPVPEPAPAEVSDATASSDFAPLVAATGVHADTDARVPSPAADDEASILQVLRWYERAVARKDSLGAKAVWPSLDARALARAFNDLQSHSLAFEDCGVTVDSVEARATCQGVATYLPKVGRRKPISARWTFSLAKAGGGWHIESAAIQ
jgi:hypothetical protein